MKFKVGDRVRYDRKFLVYIIQTSNDLYYTGIEGFEIVQINGEEVRSEDGLWFHENHLELVPEDSHFKYGEIVEVYSHADKSWEKRIFIFKIPGNVGSTYACVNILTEDEYKKGKTFDVTLWENVRKLKNQLTRKEIAEKFGVSEDFTLVDE